MQILAGFKDGETRNVAKDGKEEDVVVSRIFPTTHFGFRKITVERPLRLNFRASAQRIARPRGGEGLPGAGAVEEGTRRSCQLAGRRARAAGGHPKSKLARALPGTLVKDRDEFEGLLDTGAKGASVELPAPARKAILAALSERDETSAICSDNGNPEPDRSCVTPRACRSPSASRRSSRDRGGHPGDRAGHPADAGRG